MAKLISRRFKNANSQFVGEVECLESPSLDSLSSGDEILIVGARAL